MANLTEYLPDYYDGVAEMHQLLAAEQTVFDVGDATIERLLLNQFVMSADSQGLSLFESQLGIEVTAGASLESRRYDILMRILPPKPITLCYFRELLDSLKIPAMIQVDAVKSLIRTASEATNITPDQVNRLRYLLNVYLPSNLAYQITKQSGTANANTIRIGQARKVMMAIQVGAAPVNLGKED